MDAMRLDEANEVILNIKQEEINRFQEQIEEEKDGNKCNNIVISIMKQDIRELAVALKGQFLKNKRLISCYKEQRRINNEYLTNQQVLECKLSNTEIDNCKKNEYNS
jgi:hypothetical protein